jgi:hypothetical protein
MSTARRATPRLRPATPEEFLDCEEALAIQRIADSVQRLGDDLCAATDLRRRIRRHPFLATGLGGFAGFVGGPLMLRALKGMLTLTSCVPNPSFVPNLSSRRPHTLPGLVLASMRVVRARR